MRSYNENRMVIPIYTRLRDITDKMLVYNKVARHLCENRTGTKDILIPFNNVIATAAGMRI